MEFIITNKNNKILKSWRKYPGKDIKEAPNGFMHNNFNIYIVIDEIPEYNTDFQNIKKLDGYKFTEDTYHGNRHIKICNPIYEVTNKSSYQIIRVLNDSLGQFLDSEYPLWERAKHAGEGCYILWNKTEEELTEEELKRKEYIDSTYKWITSCREERDRREIEFLTNDVLPSLDWESRPRK